MMHLEWIPQMTQKIKGTEHQQQPQQHLIPVGAYK
jgi:hypothetical protein